MKTIQYSILCEDTAHRIFIEVLLRELKYDKIQFSFNHIFYKTLLCANRKEVLKKMALAVKYSFLQQNGFFVDILFIGIDYDDRPRQDFHAELEKLYEKINKIGREKTMIFFPVQAIEHWLLLAKRKIENPSLTKNIGDEIERIGRKTAKELLYLDSKNEKPKVITELLENVDIEWLSNQSISFNSFFQKLARKLKTYQV